MKVIVPGHKYMPANIKTKRPSIQSIQFHYDGEINGGITVHGTSCQEVLRILIDRVKFLDGQKRWDGNDEIIYHLRMALAGFESRAVQRKIENGCLQIESLPTNEDGHII
jgi:hypothetical protein